MTPEQERKLARRTLALRDVEYSWSFVFRSMGRKWALLLVVCLVMGAMVHRKNAGAGFTFLGMFFGALARDLGWWRTLRTARKFSSKVTDWNKVLELAGEPPLDDGNPEPDHEEGPC